MPVYDNLGFPHLAIQVKDISTRPIPAIANDALNHTLIMGFAEDGAPNIPRRGSGSYMINYFGDKTFDVFSKYFYHPNLAAYFAMESNAIWYVRLCDPAAKKASMVIFANVVEKNIIQYKRDPLGGLVLDVNGDPIPLTDINGDVISEPGVEITYSGRPLAAGETISGIDPETTIIGGVTTTSYPIDAREYVHPTSTGNNIGIKMWIPDNYDTDLVNRIDSLYLNFSAVRLYPPATNPDPIRDVFTSVSTPVSMKENATDMSTTRNFDITNVTRDNYFTGTGSARVDTLPVNYHVYRENIEAIANLILSKSPELAALVDHPYKVNIFTGTDFDGHPYLHASVTNSAYYFNSDRIIYLAGGTDGDTSEAKLNELTEQYLRGAIFPELQHKARYPITHLFDSGYPLQTKYKLIDFLSFRGDVKITLSTQIASSAPHDKETDLSIAQALRARLMLHPESVYHGTPVCRAEIFQQAGRLNVFPNLKFTIPASFQMLKWRSINDSGTTVKGEPRERPNNEITLFVPESINWTPATDDHRLLSWNVMANYIDYADINTLFLPDIRSVYIKDESVLSDAIFVDRVTYIMHMLYNEWTLRTGSKRPVAKRAEDIKLSMESRIYKAFNGEIQAEVSLENTPYHTALGWRSHIKCLLKTTVPDRVLDVTIVVDRID